MATPLQSIIEEDRRNNDNIVKINVPCEYAPVYQKHSTSQKNSISNVPSETTHSIHIRPMSATKIESPTMVRAGQSLFDMHDTDMAGNKIEIDSDNIETPPVARKNIAALDDKSTVNSFSNKKLQAPRPLHQRTIDEANASDAHVDNNQPLDGGDALGHFDRHSSARRTRRYRRPTDHSSGNDDRQDTTPESISPTNQMYQMPSSKYSTSELDANSMASKSNAIMDTDDLNDSMSASKPIDILSRIGRHGRNMSSINQEAVREAIRKLKSPTETPERIWSPPRDIVATPKALAAAAASKVATNHELNDEGFEETQSLVSDTPSHGKESSSSCNEPVDAKHQSISVVSPTRRSVTSSSSSSATDSTKLKSSVKSLLDRNRESLARSRSLRAGPSNVPSSNTRNTIAPIRTTSLRARTLDNGPGTRSLDVERSGSRTSLRSSRSSLNSAASTNTVRNMTMKTMPNASTARHLSTSNGSSDKSGLRKKLSQSNSGGSGPKAIGNGSYAYLRTPASRSSSSGSSIGASSRHTKTTSSSNSATPPISPQRPAFRTAVSKNSALNQSTSTSSSATARTNAKLTSLGKGIAAKTTNRMSSFMRPTTASATKVTPNRSK